MSMILRAQQNPHQRTGVIADHIPQHAHQHGGPRQLRPPLGNRHARGGGGPADIGVGGDDRVLQVKMQHLGRAKAKHHIHQHHDGGQHQQQGGLGEDGEDVGRRADDEQKQIDHIRPDLLGPVHPLRLPVKTRGGDHGDGGDPHVLTAKELAHKVGRRLPEIPRHAVQGQGAENPRDQVGRQHHHNRIGQIHGDILQGDVLAAPEGRRLGPGPLTGRPPLHSRNMGMGEAVPEKAHARESRQGEEVESH